MTKPQPESDPPPLRIEALTGEVGWLMVAMGVVGVILPGIPGTPFLIVGVLAVTPGGSKRLNRWLNNNPPKWVRKGMKPLARFVDDLERRYPRS